MNLFRVSSKWESGIWAWVKLPWTTWNSITDENCSLELFFRCYDMISFVVLRCTHLLPCMPISAQINAAQHICIPCKIEIRGIVKFSSWNFFEDLHEESLDIFQLNPNQTIDVSEPEFKMVDAKSTTSYFLGFTLDLTGQIICSKYVWKALK